MVTTTVYNSRDIPALSMSGSKLWWKRKTYHNFGRLTCNIKPSRIDEIIDNCIESIKETKKDIEAYIDTHNDFIDFGKRLIAEWHEELL